MAWVKIRTHESNQRLIDFANGPGNDNVNCALSQGTNGNPYFEIFAAANISKFHSHLKIWQIENHGSQSVIFSSVNLQVGVWQHVACILNANIGYIYINGNLVATGSSFVYPRNVIRTSNYIGESNWNEPCTNADLDEIKIFNVALNEKELAFEMYNDVFY